MASTTYLQYTAKVLLEFLIDQNRAEMQGNRGGNKVYLLVGKYFRTELCNHKAIVEFFGGQYVCGAGRHSLLPSGNDVSSAGG